MKDAGRVWGGGVTTLAKLISKRTRRKYIRRTYPDWDGILERVHQILMLSSLLCLRHPCRLQLLERAAFGGRVLLRKQSEHDQKLRRELLRKTKGIERVGLYWGRFYGRDVNLLARLLLIYLVFALRPLVLVLQGFLWRSVSSGGAPSVFLARPRRRGGLRFGRWHGLAGCVEQ